MANLEFSVTTSAGTVTFTSPEYTDAKMQRFLDWAWVQYEQLDENGDPLPDNNANRAAAVQDCFAAVLNGLKGNVLRHEEGAAVQTARDGVVDFEPDV